VGSLKDPDEGKSVHKRAKKTKLRHFIANEGKCDFETVSSVETQLFQKATYA